MADVSLKIGQTVAEKVVSEGAKNAPKAGESDFYKVLSEKIDQQGEMTKQVLEAFGMSGDKQVKIQSISAEGLEIRTEKVSVDHEIRSNGKALDLLTDVNRSALQMEDIIQMTTSGRKFNPQELLALQAGLHQIVLEVELAGKTVEQGSNSLKQTLQTQVA